MKTTNIKNSKTGRFLVVGIVNTSIDFGILNILRLLMVNLILANVISTSLALLFSFFANKKFTFKSNSKNYKKEILLFLSFTIFGLWVIQSIVIELSLIIIPNDWDSFWKINLAKLLATCVSLCWNYYTYSHFVFNKKASA